MCRRSAEGDPRPTVASFCVTSSVRAPVRAAAAAASVPAWPPPITTTSAVSHRRPVLHSMAVRRMWLVHTPARHLHRHAAIFRRFWFGFFSMVLMSRNNVRKSRSPYILTTLTNFSVWRAVHSKQNGGKIGFVRGQPRESESDATGLHASFSERRGGASGRNGS
jgi:hypothetical protein